MEFVPTPCKTGGCPELIQQVQSFLTNTPTKLMRSWGNSPSHKVGSNACRGNFLGLRVREAPGIDSTRTRLLILALLLIAS